MTRRHCPGLRTARELAWVASPVELVAWDTTGPSDRPGWLQAFWAERDARDGQPPGARLVEHYTRLDEVFELFRFSWPRTALPAQTPLTTADCGGAFCPQASPYLTVDYFRDELAASIGEVEPFTHLTPSDEIIDGRGLIYLRHGLPDGAARTTDSTGHEIWEYYRPGPTLYLSFKQFLPSPGRMSFGWHVVLLRSLRDFTGEHVPGALVPTVTGPDLAGARSFCDFKRSICGDTLRTYTARARLNCNEFVPRFHYLGPRIFGFRDLFTVQEREWDEGVWSIALAAQSDDYPRHFSRMITPSAEIRALTDSADATHLVVAVAIPESQLPSSQSPPHVTTHPTRLQIIGRRASDGFRFEKDTVVEFVPPTVNAATTDWQALVSQPIPVGLYRITVVVAQADSSGAVMSDSAVVVGTGGDPSVLQTLAVGSPTSDPSWNADRFVIPLGATHSYARGEPVALVMQVADTAVRGPYEARIEVSKVRQGTPDRPTVALTTSDVADGRIELNRTLDIHTLSAGDYLLRVRIRTPQREYAAATCVRVVR